MGNCSSCLGRRRRDSYDEVSRVVAFAHCPRSLTKGSLALQDDESRLLFDDANGLHYGSFGEQQVNGQEDPQETQREIEALQRVVARTSE